MFGISFWELILFGTACIGFPLFGAAVVVAIAMPLRAAEPRDGR